METFKTNNTMTDAIIAKFEEAIRNANTEQGFHMGRMAFDMMIKIDNIEDFNRAAQARERFVIARDVFTKAQVDRHEKSH